MDSRRVQPGDLFLACKGHAQHGLRYLEQASANGAAAVAWEPVPGGETPAGLPTVAVERLSERVGEIAARFYGDPSRHLFTVGVTGTDGKTSTAHLVAQALDRLGQPCAYLGTLGYGRLSALQDASHTTPDPVRLQRMLADFVEAGASAAAMEVSSHALDQRRVGGMKIDVAVLTNIGRDHLDYHRTIENYAAAKHRLFRRPELKAAILNRDDDFGRAWSHECTGTRHCVVYGIGGAAPVGGRYVLAENLRLGADGLSFEVRSSWGAATLRTRLLGRFNAYNLLAALAALLERDIPLADACAALAQAATVPGRIEGFRGPKARPLVVVDYAHTPQALEQILKAVRAHCAGRLWAVFGCGGDRDRGKRPLMGAAAARFADAAIVTDDNPRSEDPAAIVAEILASPEPGAGVRNLRVIHDRALAIRTAVAEAGENDVVVVAGKGHEDYQIYGGEVREFSDRAFVAELVGAKP
ncbi:MAG: UDP-N-acetylmuramoyl-L-alanyl-D-glutamate--2,6-diaminopimelate ligase [Gammaproteobacteria bacterium]|nr:UDP-N-acetylmuramoyl-L-alanyl-D-glutamate--2,6-diaminopimelate ligase [Gammaproteobacteria bacterium]